MGKKKSSYWYCVSGCLTCEGGDILPNAENLVVATTELRAKQAFKKMIRRCKQIYRKEETTLRRLAAGDGGYDDDMGSYRWYVFVFKLHRSVFPEASSAGFLATCKSKGWDYHEVLSGWIIAYESIDGGWSPGQDAAWEASGFVEYRPTTDFTDDLENVAANFDTGSDQ